MTERHFKLAALLFFLAFAGALVGLALLAERVRDFESKPLFYQGDEAIIAASVNRAAVRERTSPEQIRAYHFPIVIHLRTMRCVELRLTADMVGGSSVFCYANGTDHLIDEYVTGE